MNSSRKSTYSLYEFITRFIPNGGFIIQEDNPALTYKFISEGYAAMLGYTAQELMEVSHGSVNNIVDCLGKEEEIDEFNASSEVGAEYMMQYKLRCKDGSWKLVEDRGCKVQNENGETEYWSVVIDMDANDRLKEAQDALERVHQLTEEQESQIEEITALNSELQERQAQLEEATAEQEVQLEEIKELNHVLTVSRDRLNHDFNIISSLSTLFTGLFYIDLATNQYIQVNPTEVQTVKQIAGASGDATKTFKTICEKTIRDDFKKAFADFSDMTTLADRLQTRKSVSMQFFGLTQGWVEGTFIAADRDSNGRCTFALWMIRSINEQKEKDLLTQSEMETQLREITVLNSELEERQAQLEESTAEQESQLEEIAAINADLEKKSSLLEQQLGIVGSIANTFQALYTVDMTDYSFVELGKSREQVETVIGKKGNAIASFDAMCNYLVVPEQKAEMKAFTDLSTLQDRLAGKHFISHQYLGKNGIWSEGFFMAVSQSDVGLLTGVLWGVRTIDEFKQKEIKAAEQLTRAKEEAEAANNAKTSFLFNMSHDIRTPMNAIMGFRDLLEKYQDDPKRRQDYLRKIEESSNVLLSIINNVLEMARIEKGTIEIDESAWSAEQFNDTLYSIFHEMMNQKGISFTRQVIVKNPYVYCDPIKLREVFINILSNAYKYTNAGGSVNMHLEEIPCDREGYAMYQTTITDTGIGMSEEFLPHIFEEFARENSTTDNKIEGTGLGMPIVKRLIAFMDGSIEVSSKKGVGSTFIITIPHRIADRSSLVEHAGVEIDPKLFEGKRILLAEDNDLNAEIAFEILGDAGFIVDRAEDGAICCDKLSSAASNHYDLILMDIQMPNMSGYDAARTIRKMADNAKANIPILAMTANAFEEDKREAIRSGMNGHLAKPINVTELMKALAGILG